MKVSLNWIKDHIDVNAPIEEIADKLTKSGLEVEGVERFESLPGGLEGVVIAEVLTCIAHENADKLRVTTVDIGTEEPVQIVCGAPNVAAGQKVVVATVGSTLYPQGHEPFKIKKAKIRGVESFGMICAEDELGLGSSHDGIIVLETDLPNGTPARDYYSIEIDHIIEIGLTPNRADATSAYGVAREIKALYDIPTKPLNSFNVDTSDQSSSIEVKILDQEACPRYSGIELKNIEIKESPDWIKNRLKSIGINPINNVVDITNYILHDLGQPLHAFDADKITSNNIVVGALPEGTPFTTLDGVKRNLYASDLIIRNQEEPMCLAGVFGGEDSGVSDTTTKIFLESAYFAPDVVRKTSLNHGLKTDSSFRFERGCDPNMTLIALQKAISLLQEYANAEIASELTDLYPSPVIPFEVEVSLKRINELIGKDLPKETVKKILNNLEIEIKAENGDNLILGVPAYRVDVQREADIVEDVLRIYGYDNIEINENLSSSFLAPLPKNNVENKKRVIATTLAARGFSEMYNNSLTKAAYTSDSAIYPASENVDILNKLSEDLGIMRRSMLFSGLESIVHNINRKQSNLKLFEFGKTYIKTENSAYAETEHLSLFLTGNKTDESWQTANEATNYYDLSSHVGDLLALQNITNIEQVKYKDEYISSGIQLIYKNNPLAIIGLVSSKTLKAFDISQPVIYADIYTDVLYNSKTKAVKFKHISKFPEVKRDLSVVLNKSVTYDEIKKLALSVEKKYLRSINVFDTFEGKPLEENQKSYSVSFILNDQEQTLNDKVIDKTMSKLMTAFRKNLNAIIRE